MVCGLACLIRATSLKGNLALSYRTWSVTRWAVVCPKLIPEGHIPAFRAASWVPLEPGILQVGVS
jgi:hypothetical protein